jgi:hypothetical protein
MICPFCGLETGLPTSHETQEACIEALRSQVSELRNVLQHTRHPAEGLMLADAVLTKDAAVAAAEHREQSS